MSAKTQPARTPDNAACIGCGVALAPIDGPTHPYMLSSAACWGLYAHVLAREYGEFAYPDVHRLTVDAYAAQHPGMDDPRAIRSVAGHLVALHLSLERGMTPDAVTRAIGSFLRRAAPQVRRLDPPSFEGRTTIAEVARAGALDEHRALVRRWAEDVWQAWSPHHATTRAWAAIAVESA